MPKYCILVIDMLKDFIYGNLKCERAQHVIPNLKKIIETARSLGIPIIYVNDSHLLDIDHEFRLWGKHAVKGSEDASVVDELKPGEKDFIIEKRRYSGFFETGLDLLLRELDADTLVLTGIHTHVCVLHTAADAFFRGYNLIIITDAVQAFTEEDHLWGLKYMERIYGARLMTTIEFLKLINVY
ncbi:MAG: isochorismatase family cysteine hydrolase [Sulfolobales archaeon]